MNSYVNSYKHTADSTFALWNLLNFFFSLNIFALQFVESVDTEFARTEGQPVLKHGILIRYLSARISCIKTYMDNV